MDYRQLTLSQLDRTVEPLRPLAVFLQPRRSWIRTIRQALGMNAEQLARRIGVSEPAVLAAEKREAEGRITVNQLQRMADAMGCDVAYAFVPRKPLKVMVEERVTHVAEAMANHVSHTMQLEAQATDPHSTADRIAQLKQKLLQERWSRLWS